MRLLFIVSSFVAVTCFFSAVPSAPAPNRDWRTYTPPDQSFSVELPCEPKQTNVSTISTPIYEYTCGFEEADSFRGFTILVMKADFEKSHDETAFERSVRDSFTPNRRIVKLIPIKIDGGIGREIIVTDTRDDMDNLRGRAIIFGTHRFDVGYIATDIKLLESSEANRFMAGFKPLK